MLPKNLINYDLLAWQRRYRENANANTARIEEKILTAVLITVICLALIYFF